MEIYAESSVSQPPPKKSEQSQRTPDRGVPAFAGGQREETLRILRDAGPRGVSKEFFLYEKHWSQVAARIFELEAAGHCIKHVLLDGERYVRYILVEPEHERPLPNSPASAPVPSKPAPSWSRPASNLSLFNDDEAARA